MNSITVFHYDAFTTIPNKGNPAGVVLFADHLSDKQKQYIAKKVGFNETVFVLQSDVAHIRLQYFTPGHEINLCGHATIAALFCLRHRAFIKPQLTSITIETNVGILPINFKHIDEHIMITMKQDKPQFIDYNSSMSQLADCLGLQEHDLDLSSPVVYGSTGTWTLLVPIKSLSSFTSMVPNQALFPKTLQQNPKASIHPFCFETYHKDAFMHARHFSSPFSGTVEDAVTGTASGVMGAYYLNYIEKEREEIKFIVEQGQEINRDGKVNVHIKRLSDDRLDVYIAGTAVYVNEMIISYE